jgi:tetratricopeptide (TPR) repeat protein
VAIAHLRLGQIRFQANELDVAEQETAQAIEGLTALAGGREAGSTIGLDLAVANDLRGRILTDQDARFAEAKTAFDRAIALQEEAVAKQPRDPKPTVALGRFLNNRGILYYKEAMRTGREAKKPELYDHADKDFLKAIETLEPLAGTEEGAVELARTYNSFGGLMQDSDDAQRAQQYYRTGIDIERGLVAAHADKRGYKVELAKFCNNLAYVLSTLGTDKLGEAMSFSQAAEEQLNALANPRLPLTVAIERADTFTLRASFLEKSKPREAADNYAIALKEFEGLLTDPAAGKSSDLQVRLGDLVVSLAGFNESQPAVGGVGALLSRARAVKDAFDRKALPRGR